MLRQFQWNHTVLGRLTKYASSNWVGSCSFVQSVDSSCQRLTPLRRLYSDWKERRVNPLDHVPTGATKLYENNNTRPKFFSVVSAISAIQLLFWIYLAYFALTELKEVDKRDKKNTEDKTGIETDPNDNVVENECDENFVKKEGKQSLPATVVSSSKLRIVVSVISLGAGLFFAVSACMYPLRVVQRLSYARPTQAVQIVTYTPLGRTRTVTVPLSDITCSKSRLEGSKKGNFGLKVKGHALFFLLDQQVMDSSPNVRLFDRLIGTRQKLY